jgi:competence protein ComEC
MEFIQDQDFNPKKNLLVSSEDRNRIPSFVSFQFFRYPAFLISVWIIIGFFIQEYINLSLLMIIVLIGLGFFGQILLHKYSRWFCLASCLFWLMIAGFIHYLAYQIPIDAFRLVQGTKVTYQGTIQRINEKYYLSKIESFSGYRPVLLLKNPAQELDQFLFQRVEVTGLFRPYLACSNPGGINFQTYWRQKRIFGEIQVYKCHPIDNNTFWNNFLSSFERTRNALSNRWRMKLGEEYPYFAAMLWGEKNDLFQDSTTLLQETGIYHTFCISGLHLTILGGILLFILQKIHLPKSLAVSLSIFFCLLYLFFCSIAPSAFRAFLMFALFLIAKQIGRNTLSIHFISIAFMVMFFLQPEIIFQPGCQLSFISTLAIILYSSQIQIFSQITKLLQWIANGILLSTAVTIFTLPLLILNRLSFSSLIWTSNLILIPIAQLSILVNFISILGSWIPHLTNVFSHLIRLLIRILIILSEWSQNNIPHLFWKFEAKNQQIFGWVFWILLLFLIDLLMVKKSKAILLKSMILFSLVLVIFGFSAQPQFQVWVLDVGQGLAMISLSDNQAICIDTGGVIRNYGNTGYTILLPFLKNYGIHQLQSVYLTHYHQDHTAGIQSLVEAYDISGIYGRFESELEGGIKTTSIEYPTVSKHHHPYQIEIIPISGFQENDQALVYRLSIQNFSCLVCGDIEEEGIHQLLKAGENIIRSEVIIIPHHGSYTTNLAQLIQQVRPSLAIISTGENRYGHPDQRTLKLLNELGIPYYRTDYHGAVGFHIQRKNWKVIVHGKNDFSKMDNE